MTSSREWMMQWASATVIVAFAASTWIAGQRVVQREATNRSAHVLVSSLPCRDRAMVSGDQIEITPQQLRSCVLAKR